MEIKNIFETVKLSLERREGCEILSTNTDVGESKKYVQIGFKEKEEKYIVVIMNNIVDGYISINVVLGIQFQDESGDSIKVKNSDVNKLNQHIFPLKWSLFNGNENDDKVLMSRENLIKNDEFNEKKSDEIMDLSLYLMILGKRKMIDQIS